MSPDREPSRAAGFPDEATLAKVQRSLTAYFRKRLPGHVDPSDLVAEVMLSFAKYRGDASPTTYAFRVARRQLAQLHRQPARVEPLPTTQHRALGDPQTGGSTRVWRGELEEAVRHGIEAIPEHYADVVRLHLDGHSHREIAERLAINGNTVRSRLGRGLRQLRSRLEHRFGITTPPPATSTADLKSVPGSGDLGERPGKDLDDRRDAVDQVRSYRRPFPAATAAREVEAPQMDGVSP